MGEPEGRADWQPVQAGWGPDTAAVLPGRRRDGELATGEAPDRLRRELQGPR